MERICFLHGGFTVHGGIGRVVSTITNGMTSNSNLEVYSLSFFQENKPLAFTIDDHVNNDYLYNNRVTMTRAILTDGVIKLCKYIKNKGITILVACGALYYPLSVIGAHICGIKSICWEHTNPEYGNDYKFQSISRKFGAKNSYANIVISQEAERFYNTNFPNKRNVLIWNPAPKELYLESREYNSDSNKIISVGRLTYPKNFRRLVSLAEQLVQYNTDWHWDIYGDGEEREVLSEDIQKAGLEDYISLKGAVNDIYERYREYSIIVMTSRYEGFPMVLIEAAANGLPMLAFDVKTGPGEIIENGINGYLINEEDDSRMITSINNLLQDRNLRRKMSVNARNKANQYKLESILKKWYELLGIADDRTI